MAHNDYQPVIGLEVHVQLNTATKLFSSEPVVTAGEPNTSVSPYTLGHPGTLPVLNKAALIAALKLGLLFQCRISPVVTFSRKHYFYPDLPKGYQITQHENPVCQGGVVPVYVNKSWKHVALSHILLEEDAGKSIHDIDPEHTLIDLNRAGVALLEIVTKPVIEGAAEAEAFLRNIRKAVRWLGIGDGNMEMGNLRCDVNISLKDPSNNRMGKKVEIKNLNSFKFVRQAIAYEIQRQRETLREGRAIRQETRLYDAVQGRTYSMRSKETAHDYRYFPEPDIPAVRIGKGLLSKIQEHMPESFHELEKQLLNTTGAPYREVAMLTEDRHKAQLFMALVARGVSAKAALHWLNHPIPLSLGNSTLSFEQLVAYADTLAEFILEVEKVAVNRNAVFREILPAWLQNPRTDPLEMLRRMAATPEMAKEEIEKVIDRLIDRHASKVEEFRRGKKGIVEMFMGMVMRETQGRADPVLVRELLTGKLQGQDR